MKLNEYGFHFYTEDEDRQKPYVGYKPIRRKITPQNYKQFNSKWAYKYHSILVLEWCGDIMADWALTNRLQNEGLFDVYKSPFGNVERGEMTTVSTPTTNVALSFAMLAAKVFKDPQTQSFFKPYTELAKHENPQLWKVKGPKQLITIQNLKTTP